jgi:hypothetical protein
MGLADARLAQQMHGRDDLPDFAATASGRVMPMLANQRHELFAQGLSKGLNASEAYVEAGYVAHTGNAAMLRANQSISERVAELKSRAAAGLSITQQWLIEKSEEVRKMAMEDRNPTAAVSAIKELGILSGHRVEKRENRNINVDDLSDADLADIATGRGEGSYPSSGNSVVSH